MRHTVLFLVFTAALMSGQSRLPAAPPDSGANLPAQPVGANDLLSITVYGAPELSRTLRVTLEGSIRLPMLKQSIPVLGSMPSDIESLLAKGLSAEQILVDPIVTVTLAEVGSRPIQVAGAVKKPLTFQAGGGTTLLDALTRAEGLSAEAGHEILVTHPSGGTGTAPFTQRISVRDLLENADPKANVALQGGEEIRVPVVGRVFIVGNVLRPGAFPLNDAGGMTVMQALAVAEGLTRFATKQAYIYRSPDGQTRQELVVELRKIMDRKTPDVELQAGDIFYIPDNRKGRLTASVIDKIVAFGAGTASGALVLSTNR